MSPSLLLALLGGTLMLPRVPALLCRQNILETVRNSDGSLLEWQPRVAECDGNYQGWRCQDTLLLIHNGLQEQLVVTMGCTFAPEQEARVTQHRAGPGLSIFSYTRVCSEDLCNDLSNSLPLWAMPASAAPGSVRCPVCLSTEGCLSATELVCPAGVDHCYDGVLLMEDGHFSTKLKVQGCMPQAGCTLLNGTQEIGSITVKENCDPKAYLTCQEGIMFQLQGKLSQEPVEWTTPGIQICDVGEVCQETLLLVDVGPQSVLVGNKGCSNAQTHESQNITSHGGHLGVFLASYAHFCTSHGCNRANSSSVLLNALSPSAAPVPGNLQCPVCVKVSESCPRNSMVVTCPHGTTRCYSGFISLKNGDLSFKMRIKGCMTPDARYLLQHIKNIGVFSVKETIEEEILKEPEHKPKHKKEFEKMPPPSHGKAALACYPTWVVGLWLPLALWYGGICPQC